MSDIFISYASKDRHYAEVVAKALEQRGWTVWWDPEIVPGKRFDQVIEEELKKVRCIVVLWSSSSTASDWVITEANEGLRRKILMPALIEDDVAIPLAFRMIEAARLTGWLRQQGDLRDREFALFVKAIAEKIGQPENPPPRLEPHPGSRRRKSMFLLIAIFIAAVWFFVAPRDEISQGEKSVFPQADEARRQREAAAAAEQEAKEEAEHRAAEQRRKYEEEQRRSGEMVSVPAGDFFMGCNEKVDTECESDEKPGRTINLPEFSIHKTEVTVAQFAECVAARKCSEKGLTMPYYDNKEQPEFAWACNWGKAGREQHPINCVDWNQAQAFCAWAGRRLPSEAEWEKAARGTNGRKYPWGNEWDVKKAKTGSGGTVPVGSYPEGKSSYGALDMAGNVGEWTADWYDEKRDARSVRGGSWNNQPQNARASNRNRNERGNRNDNIGFRCAQ